MPASGEFASMPCAKHGVAGFSLNHIRLFYSLAYLLLCMFSLAILPHRRYVVDLVVSLNLGPMQLRMLCRLQWEVKGKARKQKTRI